MHGIWIKGALGMKTSMSLERVKMVIDGDKLLRDLRLPYYTIAMLRDMKVGECYELFDFYGPALPELGDAGPANAGARIERVKGGFLFSALWMLHIGKAKRRGHMYAPGVKLKLLPGRKLEIVSERFEDGEQVAFAGLRLFVRICRLAHRLASMAKAAGAKEDVRLLRPAMMKEVDHRCGYEVPFLNTLAATL